MCLPPPVSGYTVCSLYKTVLPGIIIFNPTLQHWIKIFCSLAVVQTIITTSLIAYRIWSTDKHIANVRVSWGNLASNSAYPPRVGLTLRLCGGLTFITLHCGY